MNSDLRLRVAERGMFKTPGSLARREAALAALKQKGNRP